jgi:uncharacterized membrane protein YidH (DUF202 family)
VIESLEFVPIVLAALGIILSSIKATTVRRRSDLIISVLSSFGCLLLILAQTSWWEAAVIQGKLDDTWFANQIWLLFNIIMMVVVILISLPRGRK